MAVTTKADRVRARLIPWAGSPQNAGRTRLRGGKKGQPSIEAGYAIDVRIAISELEGAHSMLGGDDHAAMNPIARRENRKTAIGKIALAARALDAILMRDEQPLPDCPVNRPPRRDR